MHLKNGRRITVIISEKQILQLMTIVNAYSDRLKIFSPTSEYAEEIERFIGKIIAQQSEELKVIE